MHAKLAEAVLPDTAFCIYDWHGNLAAAQQSVEQLIPAGATVTSVAVLAPGDTPACVGE